MQESVYNAQLLLEKKDLIPAFNRLEHIGSIRTQYAYSNWGYAVAGAAIETLSGMSYGEFLKARLFDPLEMQDSSVDSAQVSERMARPYTVLDDGEYFQLPLAPSNDGTLMASAQGIISTAADMLKFSTALLAAQRAELDGTNGSHSVLKNVANQLTFHVPTTGPSLLERSYGYGFHRIQLPNPFAGLGCNGMFVRKMPTLTHARWKWHLGHHSPRKLSRIYLSTYTSSRAQYQPHRLHQLHRFRRFSRLDQSTACRNACGR